MGLCNINYDPLNIVPNNINTANLVELDLVSIMSTFCNQIHFDSIEIKTLKQETALVVSKFNLKKHICEMNADLISLMNTKYKQKILNLQQKSQILEKDVLFEKKEHSLMEKKIGFLEQNTQNIVESKVAERTNQL